MEHPPGSGTGCGGAGTCGGCGAGSGTGGASGAWTGDGTCAVSEKFGGRIGPVTGGAANIAARWALAVSKPAPSCDRCAALRAALAASNPALMLLLAFSVAKH